MWFRKVGRFSLLQKEVRFKTRFMFTALTLNLETKPVLSGMAPDPLVYVMEIKMIY